MSPSARARAEREATGPGRSPLSWPALGGSPRGLTAGRASCLVLLHVRIPLLGRHLVEQDVGALHRVALHLLERPHLLRIEVQMGLRDQRLTVVADIAEILDALDEILPVVHGLPLALADQLADRRRLATFVLRPER